MKYMLNIYNLITSLTVFCHY